MDCLEQSLDFSSREEGAVELLCGGGKVQSVVITCLTLEQEKRDGRPRDGICEERFRQEKRLKGRESRKVGKSQAVDNNIINI